MITLKPAKLNILEFQGDDAEHWIQTIERYFDTIQTPLDKRTGFFVSYLKGTTVQWWSEIKFHAQTLPCHKILQIPMT